MVNQNQEMNMRKAESRIPGAIDPSVALPWKLPLPLFDVVTAKSWARLSYARKIAAFDGYPFLWTPRTIRWLKPKLLLALVAFLFIGTIVIARVFTNPTGQLTGVGVAAMLTDLSLAILALPFLESGALLFLRRPTPESVFLNRLQRNNVVVNTQIAILVRQALARTCRCSKDLIRPDETYLSCWRSSDALLHEFCVYISAGIGGGIDPMELAEILRTGERRTIAELLDATAAALATPHECRSSYHDTKKFNNRGNGLPEAQTPVKTLSPASHESQKRHLCGQVLCYESFFYQRRYLPQLRMVPSRANIKLALRFALFSILLTLLIPLFIAVCFPFVTSPWRTAAYVFIAFSLGTIMFYALMPLVAFGLDLLIQHAVILGERQTWFAAPTQRLLLSDIQRVETDDPKGGWRQITFYSKNASRTIAMPEKADIVRLQAALPPESMVTPRSRVWHPQCGIWDSQPGMLQWSEPFLRGFCFGRAAPFLGRAFAINALAFTLLILDDIALGAMVDRNPGILMVFTFVATAFFFLSSIVALCLAAFQHFRRPEVFTLTPDWIGVGVRGFSLSQAKGITIMKHRWRGLILRVVFPDDLFELALPKSSETIQQVVEQLRTGRAGR
jgi:hypothetical protein